MPKGNPMASKSKNQQNMQPTSFSGAKVKNDKALGANFNADTYNHSSERPRGPGEFAPIDRNPPPKKVNKD